MSALADRRLELATMQSDLDHEERELFNQGVAHVLAQWDSSLELLKRIERENNDARAKTGSPLLSWGTEVALEEELRDQERDRHEFELMERRKGRW